MSKPLILDGEPAGYELDPPECPECHGTGIGSEYNWTDPTRPPGWDCGTCAISDDGEMFGIDFAAILLDQQQQERDLQHYYKYFAPNSPVGYARAYVMGVARQAVYATDNPRVSVAWCLDQLKLAFQAFDAAIAEMEGRKQ
jgi:hypothetical protein